MCNQRNMDDNGLQVTSVHVMCVCGIFQTYTMDMECLNDIQMGYKLSKWNLFIKEL